jgi:hypothetical protein
VVEAQAMQELEQMVAETLELLELQILAVAVAEIVQGLEMLVLVDQVL